MNSKASAADRPEREIIDIPQDENSHRQRDAQNPDLFDIIPHGVIYQDEAGRILDANPAAQKILGLTLGELQSCSAEGMAWKAVGEDGSIIPADDLPFALALRTGQPTPPMTLEIHPRGKDDHFWIQVTAVPQISSGEDKPYRIVTFLTDFTETARTNIQLKEKNGFLQSIEDSAPGFLMIFDLAGVLLYANSTWLENGLYQRNKTRLEDMIHPDQYPAAWNQFIQTRESKQIRRIELCVLCAAGEYRWMEVIYSPIIIDTRVVQLTAIGIDIHARKQAEEDRQRIDERFALARRAAHIGIWDWDEANKRLYWDERTIELFGLKEGEFTGTFESWTRSIHPEDLVRSESEFLEALRGVKDYDTEFRILLPDGKVRNIKTYGKLVRDGQGKTRRMTGINIDITELMQTENKWRYFARLYATLSQVNQTIVRIQDRDALFKSICQVAVEFGEFRLAWIGLIDEESGRVTPVASTARYGNPLDFDEIDARENPYKNGLIGRAMQNETVVYSDDIQNDPSMTHWLSLAEEGGYHSAAAIPFRQGGRVLGILNLYASESGFFSIEEEQQLLTEMGLDISFALDNLEVEARRRQAEDSLRESEASLKKSQMIAHVGHWTWDIASDRLTWSEEMYRIFGIDPDLFSGNLSEVIPRAIHPDDQAKVIQANQDVQNEQNPAALEYRVVWPDKSVHTIWAQPGEKIYGEHDKIIRLSGIVQDITERKMYEDSLRLAKEKAEADQAELAILTTRLNEAQHGAKIGSWEWDMISDKVWWSEELYNIFELSAQDFTPSYEGNAAYVHPDDVGPYRQEVRRVIETGEMFDSDLRIITANHTVKHCNIQGHVEYDESGKPVRFSGTFMDITAREKAEQALAKSEALYRRAIAAADAFAYSLDYASNRYTYIDPGIESLTGIPASEFSMETLDSHIQESIMGGAFKDVPLCQSVDQIRTGEHGLLWQCDHRIRTRSGEERWITDSSVQVLDENGKPVGSIGIFQDITERKFTENALRVSEENYRRLAEELEQRVIERTARVQDLYDHAPCGYLSLDINGAFVMINQTELDWTGYTRTEVLGNRDDPASPHGPMNILQMLTPESQRQFTEKFPVFLAQGWIKDIEYDLVCKDGSLLPIVLNAVAILDDNGNYVMNRVTVFDNTDRKKAQEALRMGEVRLRKSRDELRLANAALEKAARMKDEFLASMSHELRTPLTSILGLSESLQLNSYGELNEKQNKAVRNIEESGRHLLALINDILDLSKIEAGKLGMQLQACSLAEIVQASLLLTRGMAYKKNQTVTSSMDPKVISIVADERRLKQMLVNLLSNAVKFTQPGGSLGLDVVGDPEKEEVRLTVWDTGIGIREEDMSRLFQPFVQLDSRLSREHAGTGLGLSLVQRMTEMHGGSLHVQSVSGMGSRFTIVLPWPNKPDSEKLANPDLAPAEISNVRTGQKPIQVLVVDDNVMILEMLQEYLEARHFIVHSAYSGTEMLTMIPEILPDVILLDVQMPGMDGLEATRRLRAHPDAQLAAIPIIAVTALAMAGDRERCLEAGTDDYLCKPLHMPEILTKIQALTEKKNDKFRPPAETDRP